MNSKNFYSKDYNGLEVYEGDTCLDEWGVKFIIEYSDNRTIRWMANYPKQTIVMPDYFVLHN